MVIKTFFFSVFLLSLSYVAVSITPDNVPSVAAFDADDCVYTAYIRTGSIFKGGTDSVISLHLYDEYGNCVEFSDLESWGGLMGPGYNYYERGNLDIFSGRGKCLSGPVCAMNLTSDGSGAHHGWYVNYVEVALTGIHTGCAKEHFTVEQWLALDTAPFELTAIRNYCYVPTDHQEKLIRSVASTV